MYVRDIAAGVTAGSGVCEVLSERAATAWVDGKNLLGPVVGNYCMQLAIRKAREAGVGWVCAKGERTSYARRTSILTCVTMLFRLESLRHCWLVLDAGNEGGHDC